MLSIPFDGHVCTLIIVIRKTIFSHSRFKPIVNHWCPLMTKRSNRIFTRHFWPLKKNQTKCHAKKLVDKLLWWSLTSNKKTKTLMRRFLLRGFLFIQWIDGYYKWLLAMPAAGTDFFFNWLVSISLPNKSTNIRWDSHIEYRWCCHGQFSVRSLAELERPGQPEHPKDERAPQILGWRRGGHQQKNSQS